MKEASRKSHGGKANRPSSDPDEPRKVPIKMKDGTVAYYQPRRAVAPTQRRTPRKVR